MTLSWVKTGYFSLWNHGTSVTRVSDNSNTFWQSLRVRATEVLKANVKKKERKEKEKWLPLISFHFSRRYFTKNIHVYIITITFSYFIFRFDKTVSSFLNIGNFSYFCVCGFCSYVVLYPQGNKAFPDSERFQHWIYRYELF